MKKSKFKQKLIVSLIVLIPIIFMLLTFVFPSLQIEADNLSLFGVSIFFVIPLIFIFLLIYVLVDRFKEIDSGEEDDLDKY